MVHKKKCYSVLKLLLLLLFGILFVTSSTCYASQPTLEEMTNFIDLIKVKISSGELYAPNAITGNSTSIASQFLSATSNIDFTLDNIIYTNSNFVYGQSTTKYSSQGIFLIANNGFGNDTLDFLYVNKAYTGTSYIYTKNQNLTYYPVVYNINYSSIEVLNNCNYFTINDSSLIWNANNNLSVFNNNLFFTRYKTASIYVNFSGTYYPMLNNYNGIDYNTYYNIHDEEPEEPSGDIPAGTITNNSGDTTGIVNLEPIVNGLNNIQNQISGDTQKVIDNQNQNTQTIVNTISGEVQKITNTLTDQPNLNNTIINSGDVERCFRF